MFLYIYIFTLIDIHELITNFYYYYKSYFLMETEFDSLLTTSYPKSQWGALKQIYTLIGKNKYQTNQRLELRSIHTTLSWCAQFANKSYLYNCVFTFASEFRQNNTHTLRFWCVKCTNPKGECTGQASKSKRECIILSKFLSTN